MVFIPPTHPACCDLKITVRYFDSRAELPINHLITGSYESIVFTGAVGTPFASMITANFDPGSCSMEGLQGTIKKPVSISGVGLHSGRRVRVDIVPSAPNNGITFLRTDRADSREVKACVNSISGTMLSTTLGTGASSIATVEHLMAAFFGLQIDNARVLIDGGELPILDGSAAPFVSALLAAGVVRQPHSRKFLLVKDSLRVEDGDKYIEISPDSSATFSCEIDYSSQMIGRQNLSIDILGNGIQSLFDSRTFCHNSDVESMRRAGLALGGSLENAVVVSDTEVLNAEGLRSVDEFVRHKLLDCLGDFFLLGGTMLGRVSIYKPGHALNAKFMRELVNNYHSLISDVQLPAFCGAVAESEKQRELRVASSL